jgi:hypothetical protein
LARVRSGFCPILWHMPLPGSLLGFKMSDILLNRHSMLSPDRWENPCNSKRILHKWSSQWFPLMKSRATNFLSPNQNAHTNVLGQPFHKREIYKTLSFYHGNQLVFTDNMILLHRNSYCWRGRRRTSICLSTVSEIQPCVHLYGLNTSRSFA